MKPQAPLSRSGTFSPNKVEPIHRWYPYLEGYSKTLVERELEKNAPADIVYDPFGGSGTTPLVAIMQGRRGMFSEINPVLQTVAMTKLQSVVAASENRIDFAKLEDIRASTLGGAFSDTTRTLDIGAFNRFFTESALVCLGNLAHAIHAEDDPLIRDLLKVVLASIAVPASIMVRRGDLRFATPKELGLKNPDQSFLVASKLEEIINDLHFARSLPARLGEASFASTDVRSVEIEEGVDAIVTSPPYLNGTNYFRNTKLELRLLGYINDERGLSDLYKLGITAGINNVSSQRPKPAVELDNLDEILKQLEEHSYDARIPRMVEGYFSDMNDAIKRIAKVIRPGGVLSFDIGDSQFAGIHVPTHSLLNTLIVQAGFRNLGDSVLRSRRSRNGMQLTQRVLRYERI